MAFIKIFQGNSPSGPAAYELDCQPGAFAITGAVAGVLAGRMVDAQPGSIVLTGAVAGLARGRFLDAQPGSFVLTGAAAGILAGRMIDAQPGAFTLTGATAQLPRGLYLAADPAAFTVTGADAVLLRGRVLDAQPAAFTLTGADADLVHEIVGQFELNAEAGAFTVTGAVAGLLTGRALDAQAGALALTGAAAERVFARMLDAQPGSLVLSGAAAGLVYAPLVHYELDAQPGAFTISGKPAEAYLNGLPIGGELPPALEEEFMRGGGWRQTDRRRLSRVLRPFDELFVETGGVPVARRGRPGASSARASVFVEDDEPRLDLRAVHDALFPALAARSRWRSAVRGRFYDETRESFGMTARRGLPSRAVTQWFLDNVV